MGWQWGEVGVTDRGEMCGVCVPKSHENSGVRSVIHEKSCNAFIPSTKLGFKKSKKNVHTKRHLAQRRMILFSFRGVLPPDEAEGQVNQKNTPKNCPQSNLHAKKTGIC